MIAFAELYARLDQTNSTQAKLQILVNYFATASPSDAAWTVYLLSGRKIKRTFKTAELKKWVLDICNIPEWLLQACYQHVGDLAETLHLLLPPANNAYHGSLSVLMEQIKGFQQSDTNEKEAFMHQMWQLMDGTQRFLLHKLITGGFRVGVSQQSIAKALAIHFSVPLETILYRLMGDWEPSPSFWKALGEQHAQNHIGKPFPFALAHAIEPETLSKLSWNNYIIEWKWDGIRAQIMLYPNQIFVWSRGEELVTEQFPELNSLPRPAQGCVVLDVEILCCDTQGNPAPFQHLQQRLNRKRPSKKFLTDFPIKAYAFDLLKIDLVDLRNHALVERKNILQQWLQQHPHDALTLAPFWQVNSFEEAQSFYVQARQNLAEGLMLKQTEAPYPLGRKKLLWQKWKSNPFYLDVVLVYAQKGHGKRAGLYTDYTFAIWQNNQLVTIAKAYSGLTNAEILALDKFIRQNTLEKFGPVRTVKPVLVFEIAFEGIQPSKRHKAGFALRFPRINKQRTDKTIEQADTVETLQALYKASLMH